jgi:hypothetical protein
MKELKIGDIITLENGFKLRVEETLKKIEGSKHASCHGCYFLDNGGRECSELACISTRREDGKDIIYMEI